MRLTELSSAMSLTVLLSLLPIDVATSGALKFTSLKRTHRLPVWLSYITTNLRPDHGIADRHAIQEIRYYYPMRRLPEMQHKFENAINNTADLFIPDPIAAFVYDWSVSTDCQRNSFSADAFTNTASIFTTTEEKVMVFTLIRIMASYLFAKNDELAITLNTTSHAALDVEFEIPDIELVPSYYVMLKVHKNSKGFLCDRKSKK